MVFGGTNPLLMATLILCWKASIVIGHVFFLANVVLQ
jgi:hypothetical protein